MNETQMIAVITGILGLALGALCIWLLARAINRREVLWIAMAFGLPLAAMAIAFSYLRFLSMGR